MADTQNLSDAFKIPGGNIDTTGNFLDNLDTIKIYKQNLNIKLIFQQQRGRQQDQMKIIPLQFIELESNNQLVQLHLKVDLHPI